MKLNSSAVLIKKGSEEYNNIESVITKIASENKMDGVTHVAISLNQEEGLISFKKTAGIYADIEAVENGTAPRPVAENVLELARAGELPVDPTHVQDLVAKAQQLLEGTDALDSLHGQAASFRDDTPPAKPSIEERMRDVAL